MNKRIQKKKAKQQLLQEPKQVKIPKGYGVITGNGSGNAPFDYIIHHHPIGSLVKIVSIDPYSIACELNGLVQSVSKVHVIIGR